MKGVCWLALFMMGVVRCCVWMLVAAIGCTCETSTMQLSGNVAADDLSLETLPEFLPTPTHVTVKRGALAVLPCWVKNLGSREVGTVAWRRIRDDQFLTIGKVTWVQDSDLVLEHFRKGSGVSSWDLIIRRSQPEHAGDYECQITSSQMHVRTVTLTVIDSDADFKNFKDDAKYANEALLYAGDLMHLVCNISVDNSTEFNLQWYKDGQLITLIRYPKIIITRYLAQVSKNFVSDLFIDKLSKHDAGIYECHGPGGVVDSTRVKVIKEDPSSRERDDNLEDSDFQAEQIDEEQSSHEEDRSSSSYYSDPGGTDTLQSFNSRSTGNSHLQWNGQRAATVIAFIVLVELLIEKRVFPAVS